MSENAGPENSIDNMRRVRTDPLFYAILGTIGGTYVVLIVAMLFADAVYMFTSDMTKRVILDFSTDADGKPLEIGDVVDDQFAPYGLTVSTHDPTKHPARIIDSDKPSAANSNLGTPNQAFGGAGVGRGGGEGAPGRNTMPLGKVLVIAGESLAVDQGSQRGQFVTNWVSPVRVDRVLLDALAAGDRGEIVTYAADGSVINRHAIDEPTSLGSAIAEIGDEGVSRMDVTTGSSAAEAIVEYTLAGTMSAKLKQPGRETIRIGSVRVVPGEAVQISPSSSPGSLIFTWQDPVQLDDLQLLDVNTAGGSVVTYDIDGTESSKRSIDNFGPNSVQRVEIRQRDVAKLEVQLPRGGAVTQMSFTWSGRIRDEWQRENPRLSRLFYNPITTALQKPEIQYSIRLTLISCTITAILSLWVAIPIGYLMSRHEFFGRNLIDAVLDIPIVLPPLVVGLSLLILFQFLPVSIREAVVYQIPAVILAQFAVACAFAVRTMRATFDHIDARHEQVALTLGCSRAQAFGMVVLPEAKRGVLTAATLAWARSLGEFGPLLIFAGTTRNKTEVLSTTVFLELNIGDLGAAVAVSLIMVAAAVIVLVLARAWGTRNLAI
ncbi:MAG TPA: ABC transporter permease [Pirellulaceae bacterium]|nr:ABC transporter permease [Pirellulaceae bacterium]